jgi:hypothetical protein
LSDESTAWTPAFAGVTVSGVTVCEDFLLFVIPAKAGIRTVGFDLFNGRMRILGQFVTINTATGDVTLLWTFTN